MKEEIDSFKKTHSFEEYCNFLKYMALELIASKNYEGVKELSLYLESNPDEVIKIIAYNGGKIL